MPYSINDGLIQGARYVLTYTCPVYDLHDKKFLPDNFRYVNPEKIHVAFGGRLIGKQKRKCAVCGRPSCDGYKFLDVETFEEFYVSVHCFRHPSTKAWPDGTPDDVIDSWYRRRDLEYGAANGDPLARLCVALEEIENQPDE